MAPSPKFNIFDGFFVLRPMLFFPGWSTMLAGYFMPEKNLFVFPGLSAPAAQPELILFLFFTFGSAMGASFLLNQLRDIETDKANNKLFFLAEGHLTPRMLYVETALLILLSLSAFLFKPVVGLTLVFFIVLTGYLYNYAPFKFKDRLWGSILANMLMGALAFFIGWLARADFSPRMFSDVLPYLIFNTVLYFFTTLPDREGDARANKHTPAVVWGHNTVVIFALVLFFAGLAAAWRVNDLTALFIYLLSLPFFLPLILRRELPHTVRATKFGIFFFALIICLKWPGYLILMMALFFATRLYFKKRFNFDYPNFKGN
ncbi:MAG TPA: hypothetical protein ENJ15_07685 [Caldithrix abyssi]|uniref:UbiA prenyltransferase n=1 Tax=Caldithrix abyssi TaxID=187145 RepID=A0A7V5RR14_CALAY|nr:hypothetical protein [Caldithrix abyssi]